MFEFFSTDRSNAIALRPMTAQALPEWLETHPASREWISALGFKAEPGTFAFVAGAAGKPAAVLAAPAEGAPIFGFGGLPMALPEGTYCVDITNGVSPTDVALGWGLGAYAFNAYKRPKRGPARLVWSSDANREEVERILKGVFVARDLINTPAEDMGPEQLANAASTVARDGGATITVITGDELLAQNYPTIHVVGRASSRPPRLIDLRWGGEDHPKVTLVGKGVCFDTGGLDLKPHDGMLEMKKDMGGAAVVLGLASALMSANAPIRLRVLIPAVENSVSANAYRPRDIVRTRSGKTVEVGNTDAEGRLILCDALAEADREKPDLLVDCATLTGAARIALGPEIQALFCDDDDAAHALIKAGTDVGDPLWRLPIWRPYRKLIDGKCADLNNVAPGPFAGSIIAALYLAEFVSASTCWAHLDMMAANTTTRPGRPEGGEATGMRALYEFIRRRYAG